MKKPFIIGLILINFQLWGQNLVPNPGFDELTDCPTDKSQINYAPPWVSASNDTPDIFNTCATVSDLIPPAAGGHIDSYQPPKSGNGYSGIVTYRDFLMIPNSEYMETPLIAPLEKSKTYYLEFYVSPDFTPIGNIGFTDGIGLALSDTFYYKNLNPRESLPLNPVIENRDIVIRDTAGWTRISGCYTARGGERYAIIGNFLNTQETLVEFVNPATPFFNYFYVEDVMIQVFDPLPDTLLLCAGESTLLNAAFLDANYRWSTGSTDSTITVQKPGLYIIEAIMEKCILRDTVRILSIEDIVSPPTNVTTCSGEPIRLSAPVVGTYEWSNGSTSKEIEATTSGNYALTVINKCGQFNFAIDVEVKECDCKIYVPNVFSPDGDDSNDVLELFVGCDYPFRMLRFAIFDRWGNHLYNATEGTNVQWDGTYKGKKLPKGVYIWTLEYEVTRDGTTRRFSKSSDITILK